MQELITFLSQNWAMSSALLIVFFLILFNEIQFSRKKGKEISPQTAVNLINHEEAVVVDLRDQAQYQKNHIIDAIHATIDEFDKNKMARYKNKKMILVCDRGLKSSTLAIKLRTQGFENPLVLSGGMTAWQSAQLPTVAGK